MSPARFRSNRLVTACFGAAALMLIASAFAEDRPERRGGPGAGGAPVAVDPAAKKLKTYADEAKEISTKIDTNADNVERSIGELENATDKVKDKSDKSAISEVDKRISDVRAALGRLDGETEALKKVSMRLGMEINRLKKNSGNTEATTGDGRPNRGGQLPPRRQ